MCHGVYFEVVSHCHNILTHASGPIQWARGGVRPSAAARPVLRRGEHHCALMRILEIEFVHPNASEISVSAARAMYLWISLPQSLRWRLRTHDTCMPEDKCTQSTLTVMVERPTIMHIGRSGDAWHWN